ncbi:hypothetical protein DSO57_1032620 [Entomophthora muscae]|uniref:Uncharacterized protein n=1 Tax=Entomophthora muscae TaxID=34485 RepID=A0ACC2TM78_9FUNG|nr:hypothetical protein DSO57_1032620 [Entomophthora muscae]
MRLLLSSSCFYNISDDSDMDDSDSDDADAYGYSVLAVPETITVPYKLRSGKDTTTTKPLPEAKEIVSCPYLTQAKVKTAGLTRQQGSNQAGL